MLVPTPDQPPQMAVQLDGIGTAITPQARVAVAGRIADDYGIGRVWFERAIDQQEPRDAADRRASEGARRLQSCRRGVGGARAWG